MPSASTKVCVNALASCSHTPSTQYCFMVFLTLSKWNLQYNSQ